MDDIKQRINGPQPCRFCMGSFLSSTTKRVIQLLPVDPACSFRHCQCRREVGHDGDRAGLSTGSLELAGLCLTRLCQAGRRTSSILLFPSFLPSLLLLRDLLMSPRVPVTAHDLDRSGKHLGIGEVNMAVVDFARVHEQGHPNVPVGAARQPGRTCPSMASLGWAGLEPLLETLRSCFNLLRSSATYCILRIRAIVLRARTSLCLHAYGCGRT